MRARSATATPRQMKLRIGDQMEKDNRDTNVRAHLPETTSFTCSCEVRRAIWFCVASMKQTVALKYYADIQRMGMCAENAGRAYNARLDKVQLVEDWLRSF